MLVALVTPMTADGEVDWPAVEKHIDDVDRRRRRRHRRSPARPGRRSTLTDAGEAPARCEVGKKVAAGRAKIITGGGSNETAHAIELYKASEKAGADGIMIVTPYYNKPTQAGILTHFRLVADATDLPVILYDIPGRTGVPIKYETILAHRQRTPTSWPSRTPRATSARSAGCSTRPTSCTSRATTPTCCRTWRSARRASSASPRTSPPAPYRAIVDAVNHGDLDDRHRRAQAASSRSCAPS